MSGGRSRAAAELGRGGVPTYSILGSRLFTFYLRGFFRRGFRAVRTSGEVPRDTRPLIVYANHPSWWDPIHFKLLASARLPKREVYGPMDAAALEKYRFFKKLGVFGIERSPRGAARFLRTSLEILAKPDASLWLTAEGQFTDPRQRPVRLLPGLGHLVWRLENAVVVPLALEYPFWNERNPEALSRFGRAFDLATEPRLAIEEWTQRLEQRLGETMDQLAIDVQSRDGRRFETLVAGQAGIGGVYDLWRSTRALLRGESFSSAHESEAP